jgi:hypothetical protein
MNKALNRKELNSKLSMTAPKPIKSALAKDRSAIFFKAAPHKTVAHP